jgi:hypothetical protein
MHRLRLPHFCNAGWPLPPAENLEQSLFPPTTWLDSTGNTALLPFLRQTDARIIPSQETR